MLLGHRPRIPASTSCRLVCLLSSRFGQVDAWFTSTWLAIAGRIRCTGQVPSSAGPGHRGGRDAGMQSRTPLSGDPTQPPQPTHQAARGGSVRNDRTKRRRAKPCTPGWYCVYHSNTGYLFVSCQKQSSQQCRIRLPARLDGGARAAESPQSQNHTNSQSEGGAIKFVRNISAQRRSCGAMS